MNSTIKIHLDPEEYAPVERLAQALRVSTEAIAYAGLNLMMHARGGRGPPGDRRSPSWAAASGLPPWADAARGVHIYESKQDE